MQRMLQTVLLCLLPLFASGCITHKLWTESALDEWNEPAPSPNLRLFEAPQRRDFLVMYDEYSERHTRTRTRAFFLNQNQGLLFQHLHPHYVKLDNAFGLQPLPTFCEVPVSPPAGLCVVTTQVVPVFTIYSDGREIGSYELPVYADGVGRAERIALTPVAVTIDASIVGGATGCLCLYALGQSDFQWRP